MQHNRQQRTWRAAQKRDLLPWSRQCHAPATQYASAPAPACVREAGRQNTRSARCRSKQAPLPLECASQRPPPPATFPLLRCPQRAASDGVPTASSPAALQGEPEQTPAGQPPHRDSAVVVLRASRISVKPCRSAVEAPRLTPSTAVAGGGQGAVVGGVGWLDGHPVPEQGHMDWLPLPNQGQPAACCTRTGRGSWLGSAPEGAALVGVLSTLCMPSRDTLRSPEGGAARRACSGDWLGLLASEAPPPGGWPGRSRGGSHESGTWLGAFGKRTKAVSGGAREKTGGPAAFACTEGHRCHAQRGLHGTPGSRARQPGRLASSPSIACRPSRSGASPNTPSAWGGVKERGGAQAAMRSS